MANFLKNLENLKLYVKGFLSSSNISFIIVLFVIVPLFKLFLTTYNSLPFKNFFLLTTFILLVGIVIVILIVAVKSIGQVVPKKYEIKAGNRYLSLMNPNVNFLLVLQYFLSSEPLPPPDALIEGSLKDKKVTLKELTLKEKEEWPDKEQKLSLEQITKVIQKNFVQSDKSTDKLKDEEISAESHS